MARGPATDMIARYAEAKSNRSPFENEWRMASAYCDPESYGGWNNEGPLTYNHNSASQTRRVNYDSTGPLALDKYKAVLERIATPHSMRWHGLSVADKSLMKSTRVRAYYDELSDMLFRMRYLSRANFRQSAAEVYGSMGCYGTGPIYYGQRQPNALYKGPSFMYRALPLRDIFILVNDNGEVDIVFRRFWLNFRQFKLKWPDAPLPPCFAAFGKVGGATPKETDYVEFFHVVYPRGDHDPEALDFRRHPMTSSYVCVKDQCYIGEEQGYRSLCYLTPRTSTRSGTPYGFSPASRAMAAMGGASAMKKTIIRQGQKAVDPTILTHDDGVLNGNVDLRPGFINPGGLDKQGRELIKGMPVGNIAAGQELLDAERRDINDSFFVTLFQILMETPEMTATEVVERSAEKSALLSPTMGAIQSEFLGPGIEREIDLLIEMGMLADSPNAPGLQMPPELIEAGGEYEIVYTSPMAKAMYAEEVSGFMRTVEMALGVAERTQDPSHLDHFNFPRAIPEIADYQAVPARWMNGEKERKEIADSRNQTQQQQEMLKNAAPIASAVKTASEMQQGKPAK